MDAVLQRLGIAINYNREMLIFALILARTMPIIVLTPFLGGKVAPPEIKMGMGVTLTIILWPFARAALPGPVPTEALPFLMLLLKELFVGLTIGFVNAHIYYALDMSGRLIDTVRGTAMSEVMDPHTKQRVTPTGNIYAQLFVVVFHGHGGPPYFSAGLFSFF